MRMRCQLFFQAFQVLIREWNSNALENDEEKLRKIWSLTYYLDWTVTDSHFLFNVVSKVCEESEMVITENSPIFLKDVSQEGTCYIIEEVHKGN